LNKKTHTHTKRGKGRRMIQLHHYPRWKIETITNHLGDNWQICNDPGEIEVRTSVDCGSFEETETKLEECLQYIGNDCEGLVLVDVYDGEGSIVDEKTIYLPVSDVREEEEKNITPEINKEENERIEEENERIEEEKEDGEITDDIEKDVPTESVQFKSKSLRKLSNVMKKSFSFTKKASSSDGTQLQSENEKDGEEPEWLLNHEFPNISNVGTTKVNFSDKVAMEISGVIPPKQLSNLASQTASLVTENGQRIRAFMSSGNIRLGNYSVNTKSWDEETGSYSSHDKTNVSGLAPRRIKSGGDMGRALRLHRKKKAQSERR